MAKTGSNIYKRKDGRYEGRILAGKTLSQKPKFIYVYGKTLREVKKKMMDIQKEGTQPAESPLISMQDAAKEWLHMRQSAWKPTTYDTCRRIVFRFIIPLLGKYEVTEIGAEKMTEFTAEMDKISSTPLSGSYKKYICAMVCRILSFTQQQYDMDVRLPQLPDFQIDEKLTVPPDETEMERLERFLLEHLEEDTYLGILLVCYTGIRIGELCALKWGDINLENGTISIHRNLQRVKIYDSEQSEVSEMHPHTKVEEQMPKTVHSIRTIPLADNLLSVLYAHKKAPDCYLISGKKAAWAEVRTVQYRFSSLLKKCDIPPFRFHDLRHFFASRCINQGCDTKMLSELLGHSNVQTTLNIYVHPTMQQKKNFMNHICNLQSK